MLTTQKKIGYIIDIRVRNGSDPNLRSFKMFHIRVQRGSVLVHRFYPCNAKSVEGARRAANKLSQSGDQISIMNENGEDVLIYTRK